MQTEHFMDPHMTRPQGEALAKMQQRTHPGMAHWAGSGPAGRTCRECSAWCFDMCDANQSYRRDPMDETLMPRRCKKFAKLMRAGDPDCMAGPAVPHDAAACRHFEAAHDVPLVRRGQPIDGITISFEKNGSKWMLQVTHTATGKTVARGKTHTTQKALMAAAMALAQFDWTGDPGKGPDAAQRRAVIAELNS